MSALCQLSRGECDPAWTLRDTNLPPLAMRSGGGACCGAGCRVTATRCEGRLRCRDASPVEAWIALHMRERYERSHTPGTGAMSIATRTAGNTGTWRGRVGRSPL